MQPNNITPSQHVFGVVATYHPGALADVQRAVPVETPINLVYSSVPFAVMMATPDDLHDFAVGFSLTEGIIESASDIRDIRIEPAERGLRLHISLASDKMQRHLSRARAISGRTGCGLCGIDDLASLPSAQAKHEVSPVSFAAIENAVAALPGHQPLNLATRAVHAAAFANLAGELVAVREDVGRHNALDKLIGALARGNHAARDGFMIITSRCSFEMVEKAAIYGAHTLVAISAPTSLAVERARIHDMALICLARPDSLTIFNSPERIHGLPKNIERSSA